MVKITQDYKNCIGCGTCTVLCAEFWEMNEDGTKAKPKTGKQNPETEKYELEIDEVGCNKEAAVSCPVDVISLVE